MPEEVSASEEKTHSWLRTVAKRRLAKLYPHPSLSLDDDEAEVFDDREDLEKIFSDKDEVEIALGCLSMVLRETIELHFLQSMSHEEISAKLKVNLETIKKRSHRAMVIMRHKMNRKNM